MEYLTFNAKDCTMKNVVILLGGIFLIVFCGLSISHAESETTQQDLSQFLSSDGILDLQAAMASGYQGSINIEGYSIRFDAKTGAPILRTKSDKSASDDTFWKDGLFHLPDAYSSVTEAIVYNDRLIIAQGDKLQYWNNAEWVTLKTFSGSHNIATMIVFHDTLIIGGDIPSPDSNIICWDGTNFADYSAGFTSGGSIIDFAIKDDTLVAGGNFGTFDHIAYLNPGNGTWTEYANGFNYRVNALEVYNDTLYAGGVFTRITSPDQQCNRFAYLGSSRLWRYANVNGIVGTAVRDLQTYNSKLFIAGQFYTAGGVSARGIVSWNGSSFDTLSSDFNSAVDIYELLTYNDELIVYGNFWNHTDDSISGIASYDTTGTWSGLDEGVHTYVVSSLCNYEDKLFVGGSFDDVDSVVTLNDYCVFWDGSNWTSGTGLNGAIRALTVFGSNVVAGGDFTIANSSEVNYVAQWNGTAWSGLSTGLSDTVYALTVHDDTLYAGGDFGVSEWSGTAWSDKGSLGNTIYTLASYYTDLIAGGADELVWWDETNSQWDDVGSGLNAGGVVYALDTLDGNLYAGGKFTSPSTNIAYWDNSWHAMSTGTNDTVFALAEFDGDMIVAGAFTTAGGSSASKIASWSGSSWSQLGSSLDFDGAIRTLCVYDYRLFAGGDFTDIESVNSDHIAEWIDSTSSWDEVGSGTDDVVYSLINDDDVNLIVGGEFIVTGDKVAPYFGLWNKHDYTWICGDANGDGSVNVGDGVYMINYAFKGGPAPNPVPAGDANCDGYANVGDAVYIIDYALKGGPAPDTCNGCRQQ